LMCNCTSENPFHRSWQSVSHRTPSMDRAVWVLAFAGTTVGERREPINLSSLRKQGPIRRGGCEERRDVLPSCPPTTSVVMDLCARAPLRTKQGRRLLRALRRSLPLLARHPLDPLRQHRPIRSQPRAASSSASARPMPLAAPVTAAALPDIAVISGELLAGRERVPANFRKLELNHKAVSALNVDYRTEGASPNRRES
jgi:hypothetical protein